MKRFEQGLLRLGDKVVLLAIAVWMVAIGGLFTGVWRLRGVWVLYVFATVVITTLVIQWTTAVRQRTIREAPLPRFLQRKLRETYPHLSTRDCELVERGLRQFFMACLRSKKQFVAMPSRAVDVLWHEFILHTQAYNHWCHNALGFFLHHTPAEALGAKARHNDGLRRAWYWACKEESIDPKAPSRLPLLFALDAKFAIAGGFTYVPDCSVLDRQRDGGGCGGGHCGTSFSDGSHSGSSGDFGGADSSDGGGDGGGGDGGGCGGGGGD